MKKRRRRRRSRRRIFLSAALIVILIVLLATAAVVCFGPKKKAGSAAKGSEQAADAQEAAKKGGSGQKAASQKDGSGQKAASKKEGAGQKAASQKDGSGQKAASKKDGSTQGVTSQETARELERAAQGVTSQEAAQELENPAEDGSGQKSVSAKAGPAEEGSGQKSASAKEGSAEEGSGQEGKADGTKAQDAAPAAGDGSEGSAGGEPAAGGDSGSAGGEPAETELDKGRKYLESLDERAPADVIVKIDEEKAAAKKKKKEKAYAAKREAFRDSLEGEEVWDAFDDFVFLGDSRVVGFSLYGFLPEERVLADIGDTINSIDGHLDSIRDLQPKSIFISYGINDVTSGRWPTPLEYAEDFSRILDDLKAKLPDADIYVNSILPATDYAVSYSPVWGELPQYSDAVRGVCEEKGVSFIDNGPLYEEHSDLYAGDGVHVQPDFYRYWAENQILGQYDKQNGRLTYTAPSKASKD